MTDTSANGADRREFFRINDRLVLTVTPLSIAAAEHMSQTIIEVASETDQLTQQMSTLQKSLHHLTDHIGHTHRDIARALRMLDDKINLLAQNIQLQNSPMSSENTVDVNLSAGGLAMLTEVAFEARTSMEVHMQLMPEGSHIRALANVIACDQMVDSVEEKSFYLRVAFTHMSETDRNILVKHTLNRQAEELRNIKLS